MNLKYLLLICALINPGGICFSQQTAETNSNIVNSMIGDAVIELQNKLIINGEEELYSFIYDENDPEADYIVRLARNSLSNFKILWNANDDSAKYIVRLVKGNISVKYPEIESDNILGSRTVKRNIKVDVVFSLSGNDAIPDGGNVNFSRSDKSRFDIEMLQYVEDRPESFLRSALPDETSFNRVLLPALMIGLSAAAIILFFSIRSK